MLKIFMIAVACVTLTSCGGPPPANSTSAAASTPPAFSQVNANLFRSGDLDQNDFPFLRSKGIRTIISLEHLAGEISQGDREDEWAAAAGIPLFRVPMDGHDKPTLAQINQTLALIAQPENQPVLVHCFHGKDRTGIAIAAYRIHADHWTVPDAIAELRQKGHVPQLFWWDDILNEVR